MILISAVEGSPISPPRLVTHARLPIGTPYGCPSQYLRYLRFPTGRLRLPVKYRRYRGALPLVLGSATLAQRDGRTG